MKQVFVLKKNKLLFLFLALIFFVPFVFAHYIPIDPNFGYVVRVFFDEPTNSGLIDKNPQAGSPTKINIELKDPQFGIPIDSLDIVHEKLMHIFIVGEDLNTFIHTHPDDFPDGLNKRWYGIYSINQTFQNAGKHGIVVDYTSQGVNQIKLLNFKVDGKDRLKKPKFDFSKIKKLGEYAVELQTPEEIEMGKEQEFALNIEKNGKEVKNLQMLLGSEVHVLAIDEGLSRVEHTHSYKPGHFIHSGSMTQKYSGPTVPFRLTFNKPGRYAIFGQFKHNEQVTTTNFIIEVKATKLYYYSIVLEYARYLLIFVTIIVIYTIYSRKKSKKTKRPTP